MSSKPQSHITLYEFSTDIAGHNNNTIAKINPAPFSISQVAIVENLEQYIEDIIMSLLNLVKENNTVRIPPHSLS